MTEEMNEEVQEQKNECCDGKKECCKSEKHKKCDKKKNSKELEEKQQEIDKLILENAELLKKAQYAQAELINYRKRKDEEVLEFKKYCNKDIISELILVIDNFERAIKLDDNDLTDELSKFLDGFKMMYAQLTDILKKFGVEEISRQGELFDSTLEEALMTDNLEEYDDDVVTEVLLKGYKLNGRVIRPASVKINKK